MTPITIYVADEDYARVLEALSWGLTMQGGEENPEPTEDNAKAAILEWISKTVTRYERQRHQEEYVEVPPDVAAPKPWVQPTGAHDAYTIGDVVVHNGQVWKCVEGDENDLNVWEPGVFGWEVI